MITPTGEDLKNLRERHDLTQNELADSLYGVRRESLPAWEQGRRNCPPSIFWQMVTVWDEMDLRVEEEAWELLYRGENALGAD